MSILTLICFLVLPYHAMQRYLSGGGSGQLIKLNGTGETLRIGFGSCYDEYQEGALPENNIMGDIVKESLDLWIWLGDFSYVDNKALIGQKVNLWDKLKHLSILQRILQLFRTKIPTIPSLRRHYWLNATFMNPLYEILRSHTPVLGIWDDHDYGVNDGDARNPFKIDQKSVYLDYMEEPQKSPRRHRGHHSGIYEYYRVQKAGMQVLLILMDVRYEQTKESTISETQWVWLENVLTRHGLEDDLIVVGSGIQFLMSNRIINAEHWKPKEIFRITNMLNQVLGVNAGKVIFLSGDVHHGQILSSKCPLLASHPFIEVTSSGLTHTCDRNLLGMCRLALQGNTPRKFQASDTVVDINYGLLEIKKGQQGQVDVDIWLKGSGPTTFMHQFFSTQRRPAQKSRFCENHVFHRQVGIFEKTLVHVPLTLIEAKNPLLFVGISGVFFGVSLLCSVFLWATRECVKPSCFKDE